jgi:hypothetical protein
MRVTGSSSASKMAAERSCVRSVTTPGSADIARSRSVGA